MIVNVTRKKVTTQRIALNNKSIIQQVLAGDSNVVSVTLTYKDGGVSTYTPEERA